MFFLSLLLGALGHAEATRYCPAGRLAEADDGSSKRVLISTLEAMQPDMRNFVGNIRPNLPSALAPAMTKRIIFGQPRAIDEQGVKSADEPVEIWCLRGRLDGCLVGYL